MSVKTLGAEVASVDHLVKSYSFKVKNNDHEKLLASAIFNFINCKIYPIVTNDPVFLRDSVEYTSASDYYLNYEDRPTIVNIEFNKFTFSGDLLDLCVVNSYNIKCTDP